MNMIKTTMRKNKKATRLRRMVGLGAFYTLLLFLSCSSPSQSSALAKSPTSPPTASSTEGSSSMSTLENVHEEKDVPEEQTRRQWTEEELFHNPPPPRTERRLIRTEKRGDWTITEEINKNNFMLDFVPEIPTIVVTDYDPDEDIKVQMLYNGSIYLNAWASDEDFDVAPRYVERYTGIKYGSIFMRFDKSTQAWGYDYVKYNQSKVEGVDREIYVDATKWGPQCIQDGVEERFMNEDCLYLNIWRPSKWKQSLNVTTMCKQKFLGGGMFRKDCTVIETTRTIETDGRVVIKTTTDKSSRTIPMGGLYDKDGSIYDDETNLLDEINKKKKKKNRKKKKPNMVGPGGTQNGNADPRRRDLVDYEDNLNDLDQALNDLKDVIDEETKDDSEDDGTGTTEEVLDKKGTYSVDETGLLPVMFYIHGGGFMEGSGNDPLFDGAKVAGRGQVIVVTFNYRLGIFGFLPTFGWDQWKVNGGMNGFMDIVNALIWVHRNIIKWGGNPNKITVFGPSSTPAVCLLTMCPLAAGKFQRAILQGTVRETEVVDMEVEDGHYVTQNGVSGASCLTSDQEPYQPLEGRMEISYKLFDYVNETYYNFPENPDPVRSDLIDWLKAFALNSTEIWRMAKEEGTIFIPQRPEADFDIRTGNNRDENITWTEQRRTFMTWDNDVFPRMPVDLETEFNPIDMIVGVRGRRQRGSGKNSNKDKNKGKKKDNILDTLDDKDNLFLRGNDDGVRSLQEASVAAKDRDQHTFGDSLGEEEEIKFCNESDVSESPTAAPVVSFNDDDWNTDPPRVPCVEVEFNFPGTTNDQDICVSKQWAEITARNIEGNVFAYSLDDGTDLHGYTRRRQLYHRKLTQAREKYYREQHYEHPERHRNLQRAGFDYDIESLYFFDNIFIGSVRGKGETKVRKELFNRWINFAKYGTPRVSTRAAGESKKYDVWEPFPKGTIGDDTGKGIPMPSYLHITARQNDKRSTMVPLDELISRSAVREAKKSDTDLCTYVLDEINDLDGDWVDVMLDFQANTAFEYYITILATMNPTINYVPDREYLANMPPTLAPTTIQQFIDNAELRAASPLSRKGMAMTTLQMLLGVAIVFTGYTVFG